MDEEYQGKFCFYNPPSLINLVNDTLWDSISPAQRPLASVVSAVSTQKERNKDVLNKWQFKRFLKRCHYHDPASVFGMSASEGVIEQFVAGLKPGLNFTNKFSLNVDCCDLIIYCLPESRINQPVYVSREQVEKMLGL